MKKLFTLIVIFLMTVTCAFAQAPVVSIEEGTGTYTVTSTSADAALYYLCKPCTWLDEGETPESVLQDDIMGMASMVDSEATWEMYDHMGMAPAPKTFTVADYQAMYAGQDMFIVVANVGWDGEKLAVLSNVVVQNFTVPMTDEAIAAAATAKVEAIGTVEYTEECKALIDAAREAIDALTEAQQQLVTLATYNVLIAAETKYAELEADAEAAAAVVEKIEAIGTVEYSDESLALINDARTAYNALTTAQMALITAEQLKVLEDAEARYTKLKTDALAAAAVVEKIEAIGTVEYTEASKALIDDARAAYDALTEDQKALITEEQLKTLEDAEAEYEKLMLMAMAQPVIDLIDAIAPVDDSYETAKAISDARIAYDNLIPEAQAYVTNYDDLVAAEALYADMVSFDAYRNSRSLLLGVRLTQFDNAKVRREVAGAAQKIQELEYEETLTLAENKKRVDDIYNTYLDILRKSREEVAFPALQNIAKANGKASIMLFLGVSDSQRAIDAANEGIAKLEALEYDFEADLSANLDDVFDIVLDTKINIVNAWKADFEDFKAEIIDRIRRFIGIGTLESKALNTNYDYSLTREENNAKLTDILNEIGGTTGINTINAATAKNGKYVENGKIVIVKNGKAYTAAGQMK